MESSLREMWLKGPCSEVRKNEIKSSLERLNLTILCTAQCAIPWSHCQFSTRPPGHPLPCCVPGEGCCLNKLSLFCVLSLATSPRLKSLVLLWSNTIVCKTKVENTSTPNQPTQTPNREKVDVPVLFYSVANGVCIYPYPILFFNQTTLLIFLITWYTARSVSPSFVQIEISSGTLVSAVIHLCLQSSRLFSRLVSMDQREPVAEVLCSSKAPSLNKFGREWCSQCCDLSITWREIRVLCLCWERIVSEQWQGVGWWWGIWYPGFSRHWRSVGDWVIKNLQV